MLLEVCWGNFHCILLNAFTWPPIYSIQVQTFVCLAAFSKMPKSYFRCTDEVSIAMWPKSGRSWFTWKWRQVSFFLDQNLSKSYKKDTNIIWISKRKKIDKFQGFSSKIDLATPKSVLKYILALQTQFLIQTHQTLKKYTFFKNWTNHISIISLHFFPITRTFRKTDFLSRF